MEPPAPLNVDEANSSAEPVLPWYKRPATKYVFLRVVMRLASIAAFVVLLKLFGATIKGWGNEYLAWIRTLGVVGGPLVFLVFATIFSGLSPTGYVPSVAAGITFPYEISIPLSYACTVLGSVFNLFLIRVVLKRITCFNNMSCCLRCKRAKKPNRRRNWIAGILDALLLHPVRMTILVRLPFLGNGTLNYVLSQSKLPAGPMMIGNCIGMLPGSIVFAVLGTQIRSLASMIAEGKAEPSAIAVMVVLFVVCSLSLLGVIWTTRRVMKKQGLDRAAAEAESPQGESKPLNSQSPEEPLQERLQV
jgi:uncharacterized membrane protein YdjX (TVP38/TMEM64 family)